MLGNFSQNPRRLFLHLQNDLDFWNFFLYNTMWLSKLIPGRGLWDIHWHEPLPEVWALLEESIHQALIKECKITILAFSDLNAYLIKDFNQFWGALWVFLLEICLFEKYTYSVDDFKSSSAVMAGLTIRQSRQSAYEDTRGLRRSKNEEKVPQEGKIM